MAYAYQRSNYGDYYQAGGIFGSIGSAILGGVKGFVTGGPVGAVTGAVRAVTTTKAPSAKKEIPPPAQTISVPAGYPGAVPTSGITGVVQRFVPGGETGYTVPSPVTTSGGCPPGYHRNKALVKYERALAMGKQVTPPVVKNVCVRHRSMNALNPRALRRGIRRTGSAVGMMKEALKGSGYTFKRTGAPTKRKRRRH